jgi:transposase-like protein
MVEGQSTTTVADVVAQVRDGRLEDFVSEAVVLVARELMEGEISAEVGAELGEIAPESRSTHRNGHRPRGWETRVGELELLVARKRSGPAYFPLFFEARRPAEQAIVAVVMEAYVNVVSTRKVDRLVEQLGISAMTKWSCTAAATSADWSPPLRCARSSRPRTGRPRSSASRACWSASRRSRRRSASCSKPPKRT